MNQTLVMSQKHASALLVAALAGCAGAALVSIGVSLGITHAAVALLATAGLLVPVRVPWGGSVPMGAAAIAATIALDSMAEAAATTAVALVLTSVVLVCREPRREAINTIERFSACVIGALLAVFAVSTAIDHEPAVLISALAASIGLTVADLAFAHLAAGPGHIDARSALPVHLTLACAGALIAVAVSEVGVAMATVAAFPMLITRFSFDRYAGATDTLEQTVQALGLVPELAGLAPLGHSERSSIYARALAHELGLDRAATSRVVTATRLHHLGSVPLEGGEDQMADIALDNAGAAGARVLREAKFPTDVADLLASANADTLDATAPTLEAAIVRIAAIFDELVGDDAMSADQGLAMVTASARDPHSRRAAAALMELVATEDGLVRGAIAAGDRFRAGADINLQTITAGRGELLPFTRRG